VDDVITYVICTNKLWSDEMTVSPFAFFMRRPISSFVVRLRVRNSPVAKEPNINHPQEASFIPNSTRILPYLTYPREARQTTSMQISLSKLIALSTFMIRVNCNPDKTLLALWASIPTDASTTWKPTWTRSGFKNGVYWTTLADNLTEAFRKTLQNLIELSTEHKEDFFQNPIVSKENMQTLSAYRSADNSMEQRVAHVMGSTLHIGFIDPATFQPDSEQSMTARLQLCFIKLRIFKYLVSTLWIELMSPVTAEALTPLYESIEIQARRMQKQDLRIMGPVSEVSPPLKEVSDIGIALDEHFNEFVKIFAQNAATLTPRGSQSEKHFEGETDTQ